MGVARVLSKKQPSAPPSSHMCLRGTYHCVQFLEQLSVDGFLASSPTEKAETLPVLLIPAPSFLGQCLGCGRCTRNIYGPEE